MSEETDELIYGALQKVLEDITAMRHDVREIKTELHSVRMNAVSMQQDLLNIYSVVGRYELRLDRIERRLELREASGSAIAAAAAAAPPARTALPPMRTPELREVSASAPQATAVAASAPAPARPPESA